VFRISSVDTPDEINRMIPVITSIWKNTSIREELADTLRAIAFNGGVVLKLSEKTEADALLIGVAGFTMGSTYLFTRPFIFRQDESRYSVLLALLSHARNWAIQNFYNLLVGEFDPFNNLEALLFFQTLKSTSSSRFNLSKVYQSAGTARLEPLKLIAEIPLDSSFRKDDDTMAGLNPVSPYSLLREPGRFLEESMIRLQLPDNLKAVRNDVAEGEVSLENAARKAFQLLFRADFKITSMIPGKNTLTYLLRKG